MIEEVKRINITNDYGLDKLAKMVYNIYIVLWELFMDMKSEKIALYVGILLIAIFAMGNAIAATVYSNKGPQTPEPPVQEEQNERVVEEVKKETIPYETQTVDDNSIEYGKTVVRTEGVNGERAYTYKVTYIGEKEDRREKVKEEITKQPVTKVIAKGTKEVWTCSDATSYDRNANNDNYCVSNKGGKRYVGDCEAVKLDPNYHPSQRGASYYNGCAR